MDIYPYFRRPELYMCRNVEVEEVKNIRQNVHSEEYLFRFSQSIL